MKKRYLAVAVMAAVCSMMLLNGCSGSGQGNGAGTQKVENTENADAGKTADGSQEEAGKTTGGEEKKQEIQIDIGFGPTADTPYGIAHQKMGDLITEKTGGAIKCNIFPSDQLGSTKDTIDQCLNGDAVITSTDTSMFADLGVTDLNIIQAPYLAETWEQMDRIFNSSWWDEQVAKLEEKGIKVLAANWHYGDRNTITKTKVLHPQDLKGMKIRTMQAEVYVKGYEALGAAPTPMALSDVYTALQQGTIDGLENPLATIYYNKYQEEAKYLLLDAHNKTVNIIVCGLDFYNSLSPENQQALCDAAKEAGEYHNQISEEKEKELLVAFKDEGVTISEIDYQEWKDYVESFYETTLMKNLTPGTRERIQAIMAGEEK